MRCSELEKRLKELREEYGDLTVAAYCCDEDISTVSALDQSGQKIGFKSDPKTVREFFIE